MADFLTAYKLLMKNEGGYTQDPNETYKGVDRKHWPKWDGWALVDGVKWPGFEKEKKTRALWKKMDGLLAGDTELQKRVMVFYVKNFWKPVSGDLITDQNTAEIIFDFAVNAGVKRAVMLAQLAAGVAADGVMGPKTVEAVNKVDPAFFSAAMVVQKAAHYVRCVKVNADNKRFFFNWICRALEVA